MADKEKDQKTKTSQEDVKTKEAPKKETSKDSSKESKKTAPKESDTAKLEKEVADLKKKNDELEDKYIRSQAEIQNMGTRHQKEIAGMLKYDGQKLAKEILPVIDNLERALTVEVKDETGKQLKKGVEMVHQHIVKAVNDNNVTEINNVGEKFDPTINQAVQTVPVDDDHKEDTVVQVLQKGYKLNDRVLRPAMVVVAK
ncbi:nucleotide exchange factor GrpE [Companilactobacillus mishanensis]|uniref:Protein GrpE n=1 Tax=Companilactobacillus mishanensis TaxID=2486008 RepID=A0A5P0ZEX4_9LACO|nr:nucleotide exchange factor GrpE [Companilactobacillus mishanensis]MQS51525.1 nucleotide exchange factor GrpE [Companilactobacillus mishanensis]MQS88614.1 nucleotide exchange factor GrpE [Companilactobacillus mishanensis]